jgi:N-acetylglucosaminyldiphosphoundecaprenol N-acetyl-beta-D-mannosaminyltransferase
MEPLEMSRELAHVFGIDVDRLSLTGAAGRVLDWINNRQSACRYVVTPNLDHVLLHKENPRLRDAYASAAMVVADGWPLVLASRMSPKPLPERVAGSDLVPAVFTECQQRGQQRSVFLLGAAPGVAEHAAAVIERRWSCVKVAGTYSPPLGFEHNDAENQEIISRINRVSPDLLVVGFGAPKQELWLARHADQLSVGVAFAAGATIDFFAGRQTRAPQWMRRFHLEWSHRLLTNPRRLIGRYSRNAMQLPGLIAGEFWASRGGRR